MPDKFQNKYRINSARIPWFDYGSNAAYYITICTKSKIPFFGAIENMEMVRSPIGEIVKQEWHKTPSIQSELNLIMDDFVVMPDHIHGIIICGDARHGVSTVVSRNNMFGPQRRNIPSIIRGFKSAVTIQSRKIDKQFSWQKGYYDHIIRNSNDYERIVKYIKENPTNMQK